MTLNIQIERGEQEVNEVEGTVCRDEAKIQGGRGGGGEERESRAVI